MPAGDARLNKFLLKVCEEAVLSGKYWHAPHRGREYNLSVTSARSGKGECCRRETRDERADAEARPVKA
jgi:hypothetical protein